VQLEGKEKITKKTTAVHLFHHFCTA